MAEDLIHGDGLFDLYEINVLSFGFHDKRNKWRVSAPFYHKIKSPVPCRSVNEDDQSNLLSTQWQDGNNGSGE